MIDPWGGSAYVERLTHDLAARAWEHIQEVEAAGGMAKAIDEGIPKLRIEEAAARTQARIDSGRQPVIGVNKYRPDADEPIEVLKVDNSAVRAQQIEKLRAAAGRARRAGRRGSRARPALHRGRRTRTRPGATCSRWPSTRPGPRPPSARSPTRWRRCTGGTPAQIRTISGVYRDEAGPATNIEQHPRGDRRVRRRGGPPAPHPGRQDGPGRPRPRPEGDRHRVRRPRLRRRRRPAVPDPGRGGPPGRRGRRAHRRRLLAGRRAPHAGARAARGAGRARAATTS